MKLIKWFKDLFKDKENEIVPKVEEEIEEEICKHDWEIIKKYNFLCSREDDYWEIKDEEIDKSYLTYHSYRMWSSTYQVTDEVCIECGECYNGYKIMQEFNKKIEERKELAAKLWEDGCNGD